MSGKVKVPLFGAPQRCATIDFGATAGATFGVDLRWPDGTLVKEADFVPAPVDPGNDLAQTIWRLVLEIPPNVTALEEATGTGLFAVTGDGTGAFREIGSMTLDVSNGAGVAGNPTVDLAPLPDTGIGAALVKLTRDAYGRVEGTEAAATDDLPEGSANLYFTDQRAQDAVGAIFVDSAGIEWVYDDTGHTITATLSAAVDASLALADSSVQPGDNVSDLANDAGYLTDAPSDGSPYGRMDGAWVVVGGGGGGGTVTSVGTGAGLTGGPITGSGTISLDASSIASLALADSALQPGDAIPASDVTGLATVATTGAYSDLSGLPTLGTAAAADVGDFDSVGSAAAAQAAAQSYTDSELADYTPTAGLGSAAFVSSSAFATAAQGAKADSAVQSVVAGTNVTVDNTDPLNPVVSAAPGGTGTVTSVGMSVPTGLSVAGSPITSSGTLAVSYASGYQGYTGAEASKLAGIATGAQPGTVTSVGLAGSTGLTIGSSPITTSGTLTATLSANLQSWSGIAPSSKANVASPTFTGDPKAPTPATGDNDTSIATTAFVKNQGYTTNSGTVTSVGMSVPTGLSVSGSPVTSSGTLAVTYAAGYQGYTAAEASKLGGIEAGAEANAVDSVNGQTGVVSLDASDVGAATSAQGALADTAVQPGDLATVATSGAYSDLSGLPTLGTAAAANVGDFDTAGSAAAAQSAAQTYADSKVASSITNGDTTHAPSGDAVFDALAAKADDDNVVHNTGTETIGGSKTFTSQLRNTNMFPLVDFDPSGAGRVAYVGGWSNTGYFVVNESPGSVNSRVLSVHYTNGPRWDGNDIWHAGNMPAGSGTYTPICTPSINASACSGDICNWARIGNSFVLSGSVSATPTVAGSACKIIFSLPIATTFTSGGDVGGSASGKTVPGPNYAQGYISSEAGTGDISMLFLPSTTGAYLMRFSVVVPIK